MIIQFTNLAASRIEVAGRRLETQVLEKDLKISQSGVENKINSFHETNGITVRTFANIVKNVLLVIVQ